VGPLLPGVPEQFNLSLVLAPPSLHISAVTQVVLSFRQRHRRIFINLSQAGERYLWPTRRLRNFPERQEEHARDARALGKKPGKEGRERNAKTGTKYRGRMRVLCVALWRTRPSVLFVLEARFSLPIDRTPCFNANPHRWPSASPSPYFPPPHRSFSPSSRDPILFRCCAIMPDATRREDIGRADIRTARRPMPFEKSMFHQSSVISPAAGDFSEPACETRSIDPRATGNWRPPR